MDIVLEEVRESFKISGKPISMDAPFSSDENSVTMYDVFIPGDNVIPKEERKLNADYLKTEIDRSPLPSSRIGMP